MIHMAITHFVLISSDFDGFLRLQRIYKNIPKNVFPDGGPFQFQIDAVRQVGTITNNFSFAVFQKILKTKSLFSYGLLYNF